MSKSKRNTVDPDDIIAAYGADTARWFMLSDSPPERDVIWTEEGVQGAGRFVQRLWRLVHEAGEVAALATRSHLRASAGRRLRCARAAHRALARVTEDIERLRFNVAIAHIYELANQFPGLVGEASRRSRPRLPLGRPGGRRHPRAAVPPDDAAPRGGLLGRAGAQKPRGLRALAASWSRNCWSRTASHFRSKSMVRSATTSPSLEMRRSRTSRARFWRSNRSSGRLPASRPRR